MIIVITGPTCLGKSESAIKVAKLFNAEIVNGDAFQSYKEMDIGVAKPTKEQLQSVPHHLYSFVEPTESYSIMEYQKVLRNKVVEILSKDKNVVIVGGSGLYIRSALYDYEFKEEAPVDTSSLEKLSNEELHAVLEKIDPEDAKKIHPNNRKRLIRALSIYESQKMSKSEIIANQKHELIYDDVHFFVRDMPREELYARINTRVDKMMELGLENEVKSLYEKYGDKLQCMQAIGYKEFIPYFKGEASNKDVIELIKKNTRNYAKRQMTFIRHQFPVIFYKDDNELIEVIKNG